MCSAATSEPSRATARPGKSFQETPTDYVDVIDTYRRREYDKALSSLSAKNPQAILRMLGTWQDERHVGRGFLRPDDERLQAAAVMHTDFAMRAVEDLKFNLGKVHVDIAEDLVERIRDAGRRERFRRDWLLALGYFYQSSVFELGVLDGFDSAERYYEKAVSRFPEDAEILLSAGTLHEWAGSLKYGDEEHLEDAQELYRRAIRADPSVAEAHLRYGRVLVKRGDDRTAAPSFRDALGRRPSRFVGYVARLMLGGIAERQGDLTAAIECYEAAVDLIPRWETAHVALSHALHLAGQYEESARVLRSTLEAEVTSAEDFDGWMVYELGRTTRLDELWARMREEVSY